MITPMNKLHGFELIKKIYVSEINSQVFLYRHLKTGAELLSAVNDDENKVFGITFRTPPTDSTGLPHIMEHSVLCGSRKYPVKEPFVELIKGSLNTFLNAFTYPDKTCYPVASTNLQDFYNLVDVYLDAVFFPIISPYTLMQEGWHYELLDKNEEMAFKGVVFNEMKGAYSSPDDILGDESQMQLMPDTPYGFQSGGDPEFIPDLTYQQFKTFHETFYHPSNAKIFFYGDDDPEKRLELLDEYLQEFNPIDLDSMPSLQEPFTTPVRKIIPYDAGDELENSKNYLTVNWLLPEGDQSELVLSLEILDHILLGTPASPLRKVLIESGLGEDVVGRGLTTEMRQMAFSTGMRGIKGENITAVEALIISSLETIASEGIDPKTIEASINTIEFSLRENNTGPYPRGLIVMLRTLGNWLYDHDPIEPLVFQNTLDSIKNKLASGELRFENLISSYLTTNPHRVTVILQPDSIIGKERLSKEKNRLKMVQDSLDENATEQIIQNTLKLNQIQETPDSPEALASIPMLTKSDLDPQIKTIPNEVLQTEPSTILFHNLFTSNILYLDLVFDLKTVPMEYLPYMRLFMRSLLEMGTEKESYVELIQRIGRETGGINQSIFTSQKADRENYLANLVIRSKVMVNKVPALISILEDILSIPDFANKTRFQQILLEEKSSMEAGIIPSGHRVVNNRIRAQYSPSAWITEQISGIDYLFFIRELIDSFDKKWEEISTILHTIRVNLLNQNNLVVNITIDQENFALLQPSITSFISSLPLVELSTPDWHITNQVINEGLVIPSQVNFVGKGANLFDFGYEEHGSMSVIVQYLRSTWLWEKVRVQGGAYGAFCNFDRFSGLFTYLSYRDPNVLETIKNYEKTAQFLGNIDLNEAELTKSIIGAIGEIDAYQLPDAKGYSAMLRYLMGINDENRQKYRDELLSTTIQDFVKFGNVLDQFNQQSNLVVLGSSGAIEKIQQKDQLFNIIRKII